MDNEIKQHLARHRQVIGDVLKSLIDLQRQQDEATVLQLAMLQALRELHPNFDARFDKLRAACEHLVREQSAKVREELEAIQKNWESPNPTIQ